MKNSSGGFYRIVYIHSPSVRGSESDRENENENKNESECENERAYHEREWRARFPAEYVHNISFVH